MNTRLRKSPLPSSRTSITQWFRAASQVTKNSLQRVGCPPGQPFPLSGIFGCTRHSQASLPLLSLARKFSLLIYRHISALIGPSALRHRLYAEGRSQSLHIFRIPGRSPRGASKLTARRSKVLFFVEVQQHFSLLSREGSYWSCHSRRSRSYRHFPPLPSLSRQKIVCRRAYISRQSPKPCLCQTTVCIVVHRLDFPQNAPAPPTLPRPATFSDIPGVACRTERKHIHRLSWLQPQRVILPLALERTAIHFLPR